MTDDSSSQPNQGWKFQAKEEPPTQQTVQPASASPDVPAKPSLPVDSPVQSAATLQAVAVPPKGAEGFISWTSTEFVHHEKSVKWYGLLVIGTLLLGAVIWLVTKNIFSEVVLAVCAIVLGVFAARAPRQLRYQLDEDGLKIEERSYGYSDFRSFSVIPEGGMSCINMVPMKRFLPLTTIYCDPLDEAKIVSVLSARIPLEPPRNDMVDRFVARIRF